MHRFQTSQGKAYRVYVGGQLVEFNDGVAVVNDATAAKLRADPLCGREYFEVTEQDLAAANAAVKPKGKGKGKGHDDPPANSGSGDATPPANGGAATNTETGSKTNGKQNGK